MSVIRFFSYYPDYYTEVKNPMSLFLINKKLKRGEYASLKALMSDIYLIFDNARSYNIEKSNIYEAAVRLTKIATTKARILQVNFFY